MDIAAALFTVAITVGSFAPGQEPVAPLEASIAGTVATAAAPVVGERAEHFPSLRRLQIMPPHESNQALSSLERLHIMKVIAESGGNKARAARQLGLSRRALYRRLERYGLSRSDSRRLPADEPSQAPVRTSILS